MSQPDNRKTAKSFRIIGGALGLAGTVIGGYQSAVGGSQGTAYFFLGAGLVTVLAAAIIGAIK